MLDCNISQMYIITLGHVWKGTYTERGNDKQNGDRHDIKMRSYKYKYYHYKD